jgi:quercetin dioxygenase-like cupin family protein
MITGEQRPCEGENTMHNSNVYRVSLLAAFYAFASQAGAQTLGPGEHVKPVFQQKLPNVSGKSMIAVIVTYDPGGKSPPHHHAKSAFIYAQVLSGSIRSKVDDAPARVYKTGENFYEAPGSKHGISENASKKVPASLLAVFVVDTDDTNLTVPD